MKKRKGFVSNSSSSSFIVKFPKKPESVEDVHMMMFPRGVETVSFYEGSFSSLEIAQRVFLDLKTECQVDKKVIPQDVLNCIETGGDLYKIVEKFYPEADSWDIVDLLEDFEEFDKETLEWLEDTNSFVYNLSYGDGGGALECTMEHGDIFSNLPHQRISHH